MQINNIWSDQNNNDLAASAEPMCRTNAPTWPLTLRSPDQSVQKCQLTAPSFIWTPLIIMRLPLLHIQNGVLDPIKRAMCCKGVGKHDWRQSLGRQTRAIGARWKSACWEVNGRLCDDCRWSDGCRCAYVRVCVSDGVLKRVKTSTSGGLDGWYGIVCLHTHNSHILLEICSSRKHQSVDKQLMHNYSN